MSRISLRAASRGRKAAIRDAKTKTRWAVISSGSDNPDAARFGRATGNDKGEAQIEGARASFTLTLLLVRHGETTFNAEKRIQGHLDVPLSAEGRAQARRLARRLRADWRVSDYQPTSSLPGPPHFWFSSDLARASETAVLLQDALSDANAEGFPPLPPLICSPLLRERYFGSRQGLTGVEVRARFGDNSPFDGESADAVWLRMTQAFAFIWDTCAAARSRSGENVIALVTGHGGTLRAFLCFALGADLGMMDAFQLGNISVSVIEFNGDKPKTAKGRVVLINDTAHLNPFFDEAPSAAIP